MSNRYDQGWADQRPRLSSQAVIWAVTIFVTICLSGCVLMRQKEFTRMKDNIASLQEQVSTMTSVEDELSKRVGELEAAIPKGNPEFKAGKINPDYYKLSTIDMIRQVAKDEGWRDVEGLIRMGQCESGLNCKAIGPGSRDGSPRGMWQIKVRGKVNLEGGAMTVAQAEDPVYSTIWTVRELKKGHLGMWACAYTVGLRRQ